MAQGAWQLPFTCAPPRFCTVEGRNLERTLFLVSPLCSEEQPIHVEQMRNRKLMNRAASKKPALLSMRRKEDLWGSLLTNHL
jgi:hypothetical protein